MVSAEPHIVDIPKICDPRGNLSFIQDGDKLPFEIARVYWIYDVPAGRVRHGHAFRSQSELIVALSGSFDVVTELPGGEKGKFHLARPFEGLFLPPMVWREITGFSTNSVAMVLSSELYDEGDYIRDHNLFMTMSRHGKD